MITVIHWFRQDLRLTDNPAFYEAVKQGKVLPIYILDDINPKENKLGSVSRCWLYHSLQKLNISLSGKLNVFNGDPKNILLKIFELHSIKTIYWNRCYEPWRIERDKKIKKILKNQGIIVKSFNGTLLYEPMEILKDDNSPFKVFSHFYRKCIKNIEPRTPIPKPKNINLAKYLGNPTNIDELELLPKENWYIKLLDHWNTGEEEALKKFDVFLSEKLVNYKEGRNFPYKCNVSQLSPHIHFGEISPNYIWSKLEKEKFLNNYDSIETFIKELIWREFSYYLLYHFPVLPDKNLNKKFDNFLWNEDLELFKFWKTGQTGIPIVDAGMRELWQTGYMHNRVRMITGSFLVKNLLLKWKHGERWFWDCLVDADLANNSTNWQWVAGCGVDSAPYFRIFNPILQGEKFDPKGDYTRKYVPELKFLPDKYLFKPWEAPEEILNEANIVLGKNYPKPIVNLAKTRLDALQAYKNLSIKS